MKSILSIVDNMQKGAYFQPYPLQSLRKIVIQEITKAIESGHLTPGSRIVESQIAKTMKISRSPVREAIRHMEQEGLLITIPNRGTFIPELNVKEIEELYSMRAVLEGFGAKLAAERSTQGDIARLEKVFDDMVKAAKKLHLPTLVKKHTEFHKTICDMSAHQILIDTWIRLQSRLNLFLNIRLHYRGDLQKIPETHMNILKAIKQKDPERAEWHTRQHIIQIGELIIQKIREDLASTARIQMGSGIINSR
jgi:DNA-binding GntR family transcriptional regulator